ncbi:DUF5658 family protein [Sporosarcina sp. Te-1]|uniref:DUF5658 family protein n=1 Tax=Sporosarcina sp. Te-1 TaxID=2818390 RepID=UPI001A9E060E|nr:DUF5658 family protein [Sporosarcina sp. Te-1]QTD41475.1 hypothetical protein J3U78_00990 [Sporosarcina sp. Te-1]
METARTLPHSRSRLWNASFLLLCLSMMDAIFTDLGLRQGLIEEFNPIMRTIYEMNIALFYFVKFILPLSLLFLVTKMTHLFYLRIMLLTALLLYVIIIAYHICWIVMASLNIL